MLWDKFFRCYVGDCVDLMREMPEKAFHTCVTSPPYYGLRDYGVDPFGGSGTTAGVAAAYGRKAVLCELNPEYAALVPGRVSDIANSITEKRNTRNS